MLQFSSLRLSGFKSFVDKTELEIGCGLNGIVGPNGCGKSNLVEALRWVMGESSAKRMRGSGMEDVIFSGTDRRSARNFAEVSLILDNESRQAPAAYNNSNEIEVIRKIERDKGSGYKINGKTARARDVQMLFADTVTGANSPSLVSQGHITRMINAKPQERRLVLEESAGIAGLYARRHEAETRLKAADNNLLRIEDVVSSMESRLSSLKRQARQASKYKNISAQIKQLELLITYLEWQDILDKQKEAKSKFSEAESLVAQNLITVNQLSKTQNTQAEELPALRKIEAEFSVELQRYKLELQRIEEESVRYKSDLQETKTQLHQANIDYQHEKQVFSETIDLLEKIEQEHQDLLREQEVEAALHDKKLNIRDKLKIKVIELEERYTTIKESIAEGRARQEALEKQIEHNKNRIRTLKQRNKNAMTEKSDLVVSEESKKTIAELESTTLALESKLQELNGKTDEARENIAKAEEQTDISRRSLSKAQQKYAEFNAEISMLRKFFQNGNDNNFVPIINDITTKTGFEKALSRALGDTLVASVDDKAPANWRKVDNSLDLCSLPEGVQSLLSYVDAPEELHVALSQIGFVEDLKTGEELSKFLSPGHSLVSADGFYWRWDGYHVKACARDSHAVYLEQKNKLLELEAQHSKIQENLDAADYDLEQNIAFQNRAKQEYDTLLSEIKDAEKKLGNLRPALLKIRERNMHIQSELKRYDEQIKSNNEDIAELERLLDKDKISLSILVQGQSEKGHDSNLISDIKKECDEVKELYQNAVREFDLLVQRQSTRNARIQAIADERISLKNRSIRAKDRIGKLGGRVEKLSNKLSDLKNNPVDMAVGHGEVLELISDMEVKRRDAANRLMQYENELAATNKALKEAESNLGNAREQRAHFQATLSAINEQLISMENRIKEDLDLRPEELIGHAAMDLAKYQPSDLPKLKQDKDRLSYERNSMGAVNLCADGEALELEKELTTMLHERNDLIQAIEELRGAINKINKEAQERLNVAFNHVNSHFQRLFVRLFGGGSAHLKLIESDDPAQSGLEIFAQPPGKSLQSLSLLSGGEQTLTSIALIFAMFLTNPSPICVLDEIDAPLDDANVDRVCDLLEEIAQRGKTRFLVITHHRLTMARMDRLYGVTMSEKGVSQLVSVDLQQSFDFIDKKVA